MGKSTGDDLIVDDTKQRVGHLLELRVPWLFGGLVVGGVFTIFISRFEGLIQQNVSLAFFIPIIVYLSDALGTQTETMYVRNSTTGRINFAGYFFKELAIGLATGLIFGLLLSGFSFILYTDSRVSLTVGLATLISMTVASVLALIVPIIIRRSHRDPAIGAGPFTTAIQDFISLAIYFTIASMVLIY